MIRIDHRVSLEAEKISSKKLIDTAAENVRGYFITAGAGQAMVYVEKEKEAEAIMLNPNISPALVPHIYTEALSSDTTMFQKAIEIVTMAHQWRQVSALIENIRLNSKKNIDLMTDYRAVRAAPSRVDWSGVLVYVS
jgi:hypothetical protein